MDEDYLHAYRGLVQGFANLHNLDLEIDLNGPASLKSNSGIFFVSCKRRSAVNHFEWAAPFSRTSHTGMTGRFHGVRKWLLDTIPFFCGSVQMQGR